MTSAAIDFVRAFPEQPMVLDHLAKPRIAAGEFEPWASRIREVARCENLTAKVSGLITEADWASDNEAWAIDEVTLVSLCVVAGLGVFSWRRWRESLEVIARHESTLERLRSTESAVES